MKTRRFCNRFITKPSKILWSNTKQLLKITLNNNFCANCLGRWLFNVQTRVRLNDYVHVLVNSQYRIVTVYGICVTGCGARWRLALGKYRPLHVPNTASLCSEVTCIYLVDVTATCRWRISGDTVWVSIKLKSKVFALYRLQSVCVDYWFTAFMAFS